jgi:predicted negative regulator of RcsB-dependent stress response
MAKPSPSDHESLVTQRGVLGFLEDGAFIEWLSQYGKFIAYGLVALLALLILVYRFSSSHTAKVEQDYIQASNDFVSFVRSTDGKEGAPMKETLQRLTTLMQQHPELHAAYDGALAQTLLNRGQVAEAKPFATATLKRTQSNHLTSYADYASTTLMISEQHYQEALEKALALQKTLSEELKNGDSGFGEELFALNLLRIGMLQQQLGDQKAELITWKEWLYYAGLEDSPQPSLIKINPQVFRAVIQQLAIGSISLPDYIALRQKVLKGQP